MELLSVEDYWEKLERHDWFYPWAEEDEAYPRLVEETKLLFALSRISFRHSQMYCAYYRMMYENVVSDEDNNIGNVEIPDYSKPEAA